MPPGTVSTGMTPLSKNLKNVDPRDTKVLFGVRAGCLLERTSMLLHVLPTEPGPAILAPFQK